MFPKSWRYKIIQDFDNSKRRQINFNCQEHITRLFVVHNTFTVLMESIIEVKNLTKKFSLPSKLIIPSLNAAYKRIRSLIKRKKQLLITPFVSSLGVT